MYKKLIEFFKAGKVSFKYVKSFNMDEYVGRFLMPEIFTHDLLKFNYRFAKGPP